MSGVDRNQPHYEVVWFDSTQPPAIKASALRADGCDVFGTFGEAKRAALASAIDGRDRMAETVRAIREMTLKDVEP